MKIGIKFPSRELGPDPGVIREWAHAADDLGFDHIIVVEHVLGVDPEKRPDWAASFPANSPRAPFAVTDEFHEPLVLLGHLAAHCSLELATGLLILPQRQTALVAKQAAEVDFLSAGRLRLCIGVGWNPIEYEALGVDFHSRGARVEEQIQLLRALWTQQTVEHSGRFDRVVGAGIAPLPVQRPIPLWIGGYSDRVLERAGRLADGWYHGVELEDRVHESIEKIRLAAERAGRDPASIGIEGGVHLSLGEDLERRLGEWREAGASHVMIDPMNCGKLGAGHVELLARIAELAPVGPHAEDA